MVAFENQDGVGLQTQAAAARHAHPRREIVARQFHLLTYEQAVHLIVEQRQVERLNVLKVVVARLVERRERAIHEIVVERNRYRFLATRHQLHTQALGEGRFARRRGTGDEHHAQGIVRSDVVGNLCDLFFLQRLGHIHQIVGVVGANQRVEFAHRRAAQNLLAAVLFLEHGKHFVLIRHRAQALGMFRIRHAQQQSFAEGHEVVHRELTGAQEQCRVEVVHRIAEGVVVRVEVADALEQQHLARETLATEHLNGVGGVRRHAAEGQIARHDFGHATAQAFGHFGRDAAGQCEATEVAPSHGRADAQFGLGIEVAHGFVEHKEEAARVGAQSRRRGKGEIFEVTRVVDRIVQPFDAVVHLTARHTARQIQIERLIHLFERRPLRHIVIPAVVLAIDANGFHESALLIN